MISGVDRRTVTLADDCVAAVVTPRGELDLSTIASLDTAMRAALADAGTPPRLVVDLSDVSVLRPVVLGVLLDARCRCRAHEGSLVLVVTTSEVADTLAETDVATLFDTTADLPRALQRVTALRTHPLRPRP